MAAFAIFTNGKEKNIDSYREFIERIQRETKSELGDKPIFGGPAASYTYYCAQKNRSEHNGLKEFTYRLRMKMCEGGAGIWISENPMPTFKFFVRLLERVKLPDGNTANAYYGEIRQIITAFMNYFTYLVDDTGKKVNYYNHYTDNKLFVKLIEETETLYEKNHAVFLRQYLPLNSEIEEKKFEEVIDAQAKFLKELEEIRVTWEFRQDKFDIFIKKAFEQSMQKISDLCNFAHCYIADMLADRLYEIAVSLEETAIRLKCNLDRVKESWRSKKNALILKLYEKNKEQLHINRRLHRHSIDTAEVNRTMDLVKDKLGRCGNEETLARLEVENRHWKKRLKDFNEIASTLIKIQAELETLEADQTKYKQTTSMDLPGSKTVCYKVIGENIDKRIAYLQEKRMAMSRALITFFYCRGTDRVLYTDRAGSFYVDEYNHQNYITNYGLKYFHVNCYGECVEEIQNTPYLFDDHGRYTLDENGEKIHQIATCTSQYKLGDDDLLKKITKDCGHSNKPNPECRLEEIKDLTDKEILPKNDPIDITGTLDSDSVKFLWDSFGMVLPEVLHEVATRLPKNPIHAIARLLIKRKFEASAAELRKWKEDAVKYRADIQKQRKDKAIAEKQAWRAKQMTRHQPQDDYSSHYATVHAPSFFDSLLAGSLGYY
ncbi:hypothetical protein PYW08_007418 [Mythimna loreyi]|uniref:Uncharacterized protein n=1 Tax=Mythimna loreyi TaxID=667449 RepID=A0ACC2QE76_9NEOP|nr:hypothetical protein PYW08_007418 [Mythimna loreyi]